MTLRIGAFVAGLAVALFSAACAESAPARNAPTPVVTDRASPTQTAGFTATIVPPTPAASPTPGIPTVCMPPYPAGAPTTDTVFCSDPSSMEHASVTRIVDGDTFHVLLDGADETVRVFGIDTPERGEACFSEATDELRLLVATHDGQVLLVSDDRKRDRYDRLLRYVYTPDGLSIDAVLIARGFAHAWTDDGALRDPLIALEVQARDQRAGCLWR